jgi:hypothetical protein
MKFTLYHGELPKENGTPVVEDKLANATKKGK